MPEENVNNTHLAEIANNNNNAPSSDTAPNSLEIEIDDSLYKVRLAEDQDAKHFLKLADFINKQIANARKTMPKLSRERLLMFVILNLADKKGDSMIENSKGLGCQQDEMDLSSIQNRIQKLKSTLTQALSNPSDI